MAKCTLKMPDEFWQKLSKIDSNCDEILKAAIEAGGEAALPIVKAKLESVIGSGTKYPAHGSGDLIKSLGVTKGRRNRDGDFDVKIGFGDSPPRKDGKRNGFVAAMVEYGGHGHAAKPFMKPSKTKAKKAAVEATSKKFDEEVRRIAR